MSKIVQPTRAEIERAAAILQAGGLVIVPTETVYGVAADATNPEAVRKIFEAKGRPSDNPLIVHVDSPFMVSELTDEWNEAAEALSARFWPGPLTLVVKKSGLVPGEVTAGLDTVALRMPEHPVALDLIGTAEIALAMPSANRFTELSPTRIEHIDKRLLDHVELVLDGGPCQVGLESTVVDVSEEPIRILRPGNVSRADIEAALKRSLGTPPPPAVKRSPGMHARHYAPQAPMMLVDKLGPDDAGLTFDEANDRQVRMPLNPAAYAANLYDALHRIDALSPSRILVARPPDDPAWEAIHDRLRKACEPA
jgi:L-threonylcarbamoyladenylate synthase